MAVWAVRPLSSLSGGALTRLVDPPRLEGEAQADAASLRHARYRVASLEAEFETTIAPRLRLGGFHYEGQLLPLSAKLGGALEQLESLQQFELAETTMVTPKLRGLLRQLDRTFQQEGGGQWAQFRQKYTKAVGEYLAVLRSRAAEKNRSRLADLRAELPSVPAFQDLPACANPPARFGQLALELLLQQPRVGVTLVGARSGAQAEEVVSLLR